MADLIVDARNGDRGRLFDAYGVEILAYVVRANLNTGDVHIWQGPSENRAEKFKAPLRFEPFGYKGQSVTKTEAPGTATVTVKLCHEDSAKIDRILGLLEKMDLDRRIDRGLFTEPTAEMKADAAPSTKELISDLFKKSTNYGLPAKAADPEEVAKQQMHELQSSAPRSNRGYEFL